MIEIKLSNGAFLIDQEDWERLKHYKWYISDRGVVAPALSVKEPSTVRLSRLIMRAPKGLVVDHIDGNPLNNSKTNLRITTHSKNMRNRKASSTVGRTSKYRGVIKHKNRFFAQVSLNRCMIFLGWFESEEDAAAAYDKAATFLYDEYYSRPNLPYKKDIKILNENVLKALKNST